MPYVICFLFLLFALFSHQNLSANSQDLLKVPAVISQTEFDYQGTHFVVQLIPSADAVISKAEFPGGDVNEGDFVLRCKTPVVVLRSGSKVLSEITPVEDAEFVQYKSDSNWKAWGQSPLFLLTRKDKLPLIVFAQYGTSNGLFYRIYLIQHQTDKFEIRLLEFSDICDPDWKNVLFGYKIQMFYYEIRKRDVLRVDGFDNSLEDRFTSQYMEEESDQVRWRLVEHHSAMSPIENPEK